MFGIQPTPEMTVRPKHPHYLVWIQFNDRQGNHVRYDVNADNARKEWMIREEFTVYGRAWSYGDLPLGIFGSGLEMREQAEKMAVEKLRQHYPGLI